MGKKQRITVLLDPEDTEFLEDKSRETGISLSALVRQAVKKEIKREKAGLEDKWRKNWITKTKIKKEK